MPHNPNYRLLLKSKKRRQKRSRQKRKIDSHSKYMATPPVGHIRYNDGSDTQTRYTIHIETAPLHLTNLGSQVNYHNLEHLSLRLPMTEKDLDLTVRQLLQRSMDLRFQGKSKNPSQTPGNAKRRSHTKVLPSIQQLTGIENEPW